MRILVIDAERKWREHWASQGVPVVETLAEAMPVIAAGIDLVLLSALKLHLAPALELAGVTRIVVMTSLPTTEQAIAAYRAGGNAGRVIDYLVKDFSMTVGDVVQRYGASVEAR